MVEHEDELSAAEPFETSTHAFVLRVWREEPLTDNGESMWRGHITHVQSGQRRYFQHLREVAAFLTTYSVRIDNGANKRLCCISRLQHWFCQRLHCSDKH